MARRVRKALRKRLLEVASRQSGYFSAGQALAAGYSYPAQHYHALNENWLRVPRGVFRLPEWPSSPHEDLVRWTLWSGQKGVVSHENAIAVHELGDVNSVGVHLSVPLRLSRQDGRDRPASGDGSADRKAGACGLWVTTPLRSLIDVASGSLDLDQVVTVVVEAQRRGGSSISWHQREKMTASCVGSSSTPRRPSSGGTLTAYSGPMA